MWVITVKGKPATLGKINQEERKSHNARDLDYQEVDTYLTGKTKGAAVELYLFNYGFTWRERPKTVDVKKIV